VFAREESAGYLGQDLYLIYDGLPELAGYSFRAFPSMRVFSIFLIDLNTHVCFVGENHGLDLS